MATPIYSWLKGENPNDSNDSGGGKTTYVLPSASEDISSAYQNDNYKMNFSKFVLLNLDLDKMDLDNPLEFNTESLNPITDKGELLINSLRNYVANNEVTIKESLLNNNEPFYDPNVLNTTSERIFWKWLKKSGILEFEAAIPNDEYVDSAEFAVDQNLSEDYFKEYLWKERDVISYNITNIEDEQVDLPDPSDNDTLKRLYKITLNSSSNIKPYDTVIVKSEGNINIGFGGEKSFIVTNIATTEESNSKNDIVYILSSDTLVWNNFATASLKLDYTKVIKYIGEVSAVNNVQNKDRSYTEINAYIPDQVGETPDILFRVNGDRNYSPGLQYPILPQQDQPEIIGGEQLDSPINTMPEQFPGDQFAYFDVDQKYVNSSGLLDRKTGEYFGIYETDRNAERVVQTPYVFPEFDAKSIDGLTLDFDPVHYSKMNLPTFKSENFDEFNAQSFNGEAPKDFEFNVVLWFYEVQDVSLEDSNNSDESTSGTAEINVDDSNPNASSVATNLYGLTFLNNTNKGEGIETFKKLVANGKQDGTSYSLNLNLNFNISTENVIETYDSDKVNSMFGFDLYNETMRRLADTNDIFLQLANDIVYMKQDIQTVKNLQYSSSDIRDINKKIESLNELLLLYQRNQIVDSDSIVVEVIETSNPPSMKLHSIDPRYGESYQFPVSLLYSNQNNTVLNNKILVPKGKDFLVNIINDDNSDITLDNNLNIVLDRDLDFKQTCNIKIYPNNSSFNKKLDISILTSLVENYDTEKGASLLKDVDLPIDNNLNVNIEEDGVIKRWNNIDNNILPDNIGLRKIADSYYCVIVLNPILINSFKTGDVIYLDNFDFLLEKSIPTDEPISSNITGQYEIIGQIENNEIVVEVTDEAFKSIYDNEAVNIDSNTTYYLNNVVYMKQPPILKLNSGWDISIICNDNESTSLNEKYLIEVKPLKKEDI